MTVRKLLTTPMLAVGLAGLLAGACSDGGDPNSSSSIALPLAPTAVGSAPDAIRTAATPDESQRLRGLGGRVFLVDVEVLTAIPGLPFEAGDHFPNCYVFKAGGGSGDWEETGAPTAGTWEQHSKGAKTSYTVAASAGPPVVLNQTGTVTPAGGGGVLQLVADSTAEIPGVVTLGTFLSVGSEIDESERAARCPTF